MDRLAKAPQKLRSGEHARVESVLVKIAARDWSGLDVEKLKGRDDMYRVRTGSIRIIFRVADAQVFIVSIERRSGTTYNF